MYNTSFSCFTTSDSLIVTLPLLSEIGEKLFSPCSQLGTKTFYWPIYTVIITHCLCGTKIAMLFHGGDILIEVSNSLRYSSMEQIRPYSQGGKIAPLDHGADILMCVFFQLKQTNYINLLHLCLPYTGKKTNKSMKK